MNTKILKRLFLVALACSVTSSASEMMLRYRYAGYQGYSTYKANLMEVYSINFMKEQPDEEGDSLMLKVEGTKPLKDLEENDMYDTDINIEFHDEDEESPEVEEKSSQFNTVIRLRNEATATRIIARTQIATLKSVLYYDYIDIIRGVDLISKMKQENQEISNVLGKTTIKFVDIKSTKEDEKK
jgi:hypothetical protein